MKVIWFYILILLYSGAHGAPTAEQCSMADNMISSHLSQVGCETIEKDLSAISCKRLRLKHLPIVKQCYEVELTGTPLSYCIKRKTDVNKVTNRCVKTYLKPKDTYQLKRLFDSNMKCLVDGFDQLCGEEAGKVIQANLKKIKYLKGIDEVFDEDTMEIHS
ncbi:Protein CBG04725 [Caenorhabditis briggsae]|uniref:Protein CBG04725 n=1 Tax=Caenorhabditis briggsae TaxID=6238 RepID=A8WYB6_CAEBR|nr:Protein CBG04725 [Caenorhabditis briggsae]CAP25374.2 Protein CBG04725 [Caenorhabditis briggsae]